ncbi:XdhC family protein [Glaciihabitans sp. dw_435]|uniref:XdhC family protein n=1 Tax=Glaciihabitans sp. dw_435 TaxID=2720081 RepID=UPI001BD41529|nr:XdhC/CoxI family protein [Glaciihabitans sp. dw_435]
MFEIADRLLAALDRGVPLAVATAVSIQGSAPRTVGTSMAYDGAAVIGSIAGGCVEGAVVGACEEVLDDGMTRTVEYGVSDEMAYGVGLTCGGQLRITVQLVTKDSPVAAQLREAVAGRVAGIATIVDGGEDGVATTATTTFDRRIDAELTARVSLGESALTIVDCDSELVEVFFEVSSAPPRMIIFGAMEFSAALAAASTVLGYRVTVCDPRELFTTAQRFPGAETVVSWPTTYLAQTEVDERTVIAILSHDSRFDAELVDIALGLPAAFVGAMGSRRTHDRRIASLRERGVSEDRIARLHSPIGLDLGASTPEETAISILAEVVATRTRSTAASLARTEGTIHRI